MSPDSRSAGRSVGDSGRRSLFPLVPVSLPARERVSAIKGAPRNNSILKLDDWTDTTRRTGRTDVVGDNGDFTMPVLHAPGDLLAGNFPSDEK